MIWYKFILWVCLHSFSKFFSGFSSSHLECYFTKVLWQIFFIDHQVKNMIYTKILISFIFLTIFRKVIFFLCIRNFSRTWTSNRPIYRKKRIITESEISESLIFPSKGLRQIENIIQHYSTINFMTINADV